jgi:hypothetical protein
VYLFRFWLSCFLLKNAVFWDVATRSSCVNQSFGRTYRLHLQGRKNPRARNQCEQVGFCLSKSWKSLICLLKKPDAKSTRPCRSMHAQQSSPEATGSMPIRYTFLVHPPLPDTLLYNLWPATCSSISMTLPLPLNTLLISYLFMTDSSVCSHLLTLVPRSRIFSTLKMEVIRSSETSVHARTTGRYIQENGILHGL